MRALTPTHAVDRFELICQTIEYEKQYDAEKDLTEFYAAAKAIKNEFVGKWVQDALREREAYLKSKGIERMLQV